MNLAFVAVVGLGFDVVELDFDVCAPTAALDVTELDATLEEVAVRARTANLGLLR